jgi:hypothetical protein
LEIDDSVANTGGQSLKIVGITATGVYYNVRVFYDNVPVELGKTFTVAFWAKVDENEAQERDIRVCWGADSYSEPIILDSADWKEYSYTFMSNAMGSTRVGLAVSRSDVDFWVDDFRFFEGDISDEKNPVNIVKGDANLDGRIGADDAILTLYIAAGLVDYTDEQKLAADANDDGRISANDAILILRKSAGLAAPSPETLELFSKLMKDLDLNSHNELFQNFPNPFNPHTWIPYQLGEDCQVKIQIFSVRGDLLRELDLGYQTAGLYLSRHKAAYWDGRDESAETVASGVYFYKISAGHYHALRKLTILR